MPQSVKHIQYEEHFNLKQLMMCYLNPHTLSCEAARGFGKTTGPQAWRLVHNAKAMPRSSGAFGAPNFTKFVNHLLPAILKAWESMYHMKEGEHFVLFKRPPWKFSDGTDVKPYMSPGKFDHYITFRNGSGFHIISFDWGSTSNGLDTDYCVIDEAKLIDGERVQSELFNTLRGNNDRFGQLPEHLSKWLFSDKYVKKGTRQSRWIKEYQKQTCSESMLEEVWAWLHAADNCGAHEQAAKNECLAQAALLQKKMTMYVEATVLDNLHALGPDYIENTYKSNPASQFLISLFNMEISKDEGTLFYYQFMEAIHGYYAGNNSRILGAIQDKGFTDYHNNRNCEYDLDVNPNVELRLYVDLGGKYNWCTTGQITGNNWKLLNEAYVVQPRKYEHMIDDWCEYYAPHKNKKVKFFYDVQADKLNPRDAMTDKQKMIEKLQANGWTVEDMCEGRGYVSHHIKYRFWEKVLDASEGRDERFPLFSINLNNCVYTVKSISGAKIVKGEKNLQKDKSTERDEKFDQRESTHLSDTCDWQVVEYLDLLDSDNGYSDIMM